MKSPTAQMPERWAQPVTQSKMTKTIFMVLLVVAFSCKEGYEASNDSDKDSLNIHADVILSEDNSTPTVDISKYTLINDDQKDRRSDAKEFYN